MVRDIPMPHYAGADLLAESWRQIGVTTTQDRRNIWDWRKVIDSGDFDVALDFSGDFYDEIRLARPVVGQLFRVDRPVSGRPLHRPGGDQRPAVTGQDRARFRAPRPDRGLHGSALVVEPHRTSVALKGWAITPSHFIGQDLTDVWLEH